MDPQVMIFGAGGAVLAVFVIQVYRSFRGDGDLGPVSDEWLVDRQRERSDRFT